MTSHRKRLVILGGGFGAYSLLGGLRSELYEVTVVSPRNYFLFTPLLPSAVSGTVEFRSILEPIRRGYPEVTLLEAWAENIDLDASTVACRGVVNDEAFELSWDLLVVAVGAGVADYGIPGVREHCLTLVSVPDARRLRSSLLERFAEAEIPGLSDEEIERRLRILVCGGGPTGVEVAAEMQDLIDRELRTMFPDLAPRAKVVLIEAAERLLTSFDQALSEYARRQFARDGIQVRTESSVASVGEDVVVLDDGERIACGMAVWAAGNQQLPLVERLEVAKDSSGRLKVDQHLRLVEHRSVFALGDCASLSEPPYPATAQVAQQQGKYLGLALSRLARGKAPKSFEYRPMGMLAYIGGGRALADLPSAKWSGRTAGLFWRSVYLTRLVSLSNKVKVLFDWFKARLLGRDLSRF